MVFILAETDQNTMILGVVTGFLSFLSLVFTGIMAYKTMLISREQKSLAAAVEEVHKATNGLTEKLSTAKLLEGKAQGKSEERDRADLQKMYENQAVADATALPPVAIPVKVTNPEPVPVKETP